MSESVVCPFCGEDDFDKVGLKIHLVRFCEDFHRLGEAPRSGQPVTDVPAIAARKEK